MSTVDAADVLRMQLDLRDRFRDPVFRQAIATQWRAINDYEIPADALGETMGSTMGWARSYRVEQQMTKVITDRSDALDDDAPFTHPPGMMGFVIFEEPLELTEVRGRTELIHALTWGPVLLGSSEGAIRLRRPPLPEDIPPDKMGVLISAWNDVYRQPDQVFTEAVLPEVAGNPGFRRQLDHMGRWSLCVLRPTPMFQHVGPITIPTDDATRERLAHEGWHGTVVDGTRNIFRDLSVLFAMLGERVPAARMETVEPTSRQARKHVTREGLKPEVITVTLRPEYRIADEHRTGTGRTVKVRYPVVSHYRTIHPGTPRERRVPVRAHWKGPEDGPDGPPKLWTLAR